MLGGLIGEKKETKGKPHMVGGMGGAGVHRRRLEFCLGESWLFFPLAHNDLVCLNFGRFISRHGQARKCTIGDWSETKMEGGGMEGTRAEPGEHGAMLERILWLY